MNPPITLEKPKTPVIQFHEIEKLRLELRKQSQNKERLAEFETTINEALKQGDKKGVIEFTNEEWNSLITNENLPPIEEVKSLLRRKITERKEITTETQVEQKGFLAEMREKGEKKLQTVTEKGKELLTGTKAEIEDKIKKNADKIKKFGKLAFLGTAALSIGLSLKIWGYKILKFLSFGLYNPEEAISQIEKEKFILEHPEEAVKKYGQEVVDAVKKGATGKDGEKKGEEQKPEGMFENAKGPLKILAGIIGLGTATGVMGKLLSGKSAKWLVEKHPAIMAAKGITGLGIGTMKFVGRLGVLGLVGYGAYRLYEHFEKNPSDLAQAGENPDKSWWSSMIEKVWSKDPKNAKTEREKKYLLSFVSGEKKIEETTEDEHPEGMEGMGEKMEKVIDETSEPFMGLVEEIRKSPKTSTILALVIGSKIGIGNILRFTRMNVSIALNLAQTAFWGMPLTAVFGVIAYLGAKKIASESVPKDPKEFEDFIVEHSEEIDEYCEKEGLKGDDGKSIVKESQLRNIASYIAVPEKIKTSIMTVLGKVTDAANHIGKNVLGESPEIAEQGKNLLGIHTMARNINDEAEENNDEKYKQIGKKLDEIAGRVAHIDFEQKTLTTQIVTETDIQELKKACEGTDILIESHHGYILWSHAEQNDGSTTYLSVPQRICIDPAVTDPKKRHDLAKEFRVDTESNLIDYLSGMAEAGISDIQGLIYGLTEALSLNDEKKAANTVLMLLKRGYNLVTFGTQVFFEGAEQTLIELPSNTIRVLMGFAGAKDWGITMQEFGVQYANGLIPMGIFTLTAGLTNPIAHHQNIALRTIGKIPLIGKPTNIVVKSIIQPLRVSVDMLKFAGKSIMNPSRLLTGPSLRARYLHANMASFLSDGLAKNAGLLVEGIRARYTLDAMDSVLMSGRGRVHEAGQFRHYLEQYLGKHGNLNINGKQMGAEEIAELARDDRKSIKEIIKALDQHLASTRVEFMKASPRVRAIIDTMKKIAGSTPAKIDKIIGDLLKSGNTNWPKMMAKMEQLNPGTSGAFMAYMLYDLHHSEDKGKTVIEHTAGWIGFLAGRKATKATVGKLFKNPLVQEFLGLVGGVSGSMFGPQIISPEAIEGRIGQWLDTGEFTHAIFNSASDLEYIAGARILAKSALGNTILKVGAKRAGLELLAKKVSQKIAGTLIEKFIIKLGEKIGFIVAERGAVAAGAAWIPVAGWVFDAGLAIWTTVDICLITNMVVKAQNMKSKHESQSKKAIKDVVIDRRGEESIADLVKVSEGKDYHAMTEAEKDDAKLKYFEQVPRCNITIEREDGSIETYGYAAGNPSYAKIQEKDGTVTELTKEDLNQAETWELPNNYRTEKIPYKDLPPDQLKFYYGIQIQKLKIATQWQQLDSKVESDKKVTISREQFSHDTISIERQPDNSWQIVSNKKQIALPGKYDFHGALALAGLALYSMEFLVKEVKEKGDKAWKSEDGTLTPFYSDKDSIIYALDDEMDTNFIEKWLPFYENNLKLRPSQMVQVLNGYFGAVAKDLNLIGD